MNPSTTAVKASTLIEVIAERQAALDLTDENLGAAVGFERPSIMAMIKTGVIKFPLSKIPALAATLELDAATLLVTAMKESAPDLLELINAVWGPRDLTPEEGLLVQHCRKLANGSRVAPIVFADSVIALVTV